MNVVDQSGIRTELSGGTAIVRLVKPPVNSLDIELLAQLEEEVTRLGQTDAVRSIVLTGSGKAFSAGVDLHRVLEGGRPYTERLITRMSSCFETIYSVPMPVVAAVNGHAIAGGCALALACDVRYMSPGKFGLNELALGLAFPPVILEIIATVLGERAYPVITGAQLYTAEEALDLGMIDRVAAAEELEREAMAESARLGSIAVPAFVATKRALRARHNSRDTAVVAADLAADWLMPANLERFQAIVRR